MCQRLYLENHLPEMAMHMKLLEFDRPGRKIIKIDKKTMYIVLRGEVKIKREKNLEWDEVSDMAFKEINTEESPL
jgi:hypothetical protein